jgi:hypothetical protein
MKGIVFTELLDMVEAKFGHSTLQNTIKTANLGHDGVYVAGGYYPFEELAGIVVALSKVTNVPVPDLLFAYGRHLFGVLIKGYPQFAEGKKTPLDFMESIDNYIHVEVRKLYPDAELPKFHVESKTNDKIIILYESPRRLENLAHGLMVGCADYYNQPLDIQYAPAPEISEHTVRFQVALAKGHSSPTTSMPTAKPEKKGFWDFLKKLFS